MAGDYVDPLVQVGAAHPVEPRQGLTRRTSGAPHRGVASGVVVGVHSRTTQHAEPHRLDASVGAAEHSEIVIQIDEGDVSELMGRRVAIHFNIE